MKYIKMFESFEGEYYKEVDLSEQEEWAMSDYYTNREKFTTNEVSKLKELIPELDCYDDTNPISNFNYISCESNVFSKKFDYTNNVGNIYKYIEIYKITDDYYYLQFHTHSYNETLVCTYGSYYKCDQFDGLLRCIEDNILS
jgi:GH35 family endo-1,4-beta-xylanase